ncbi:MAG TPA: class II fructose-bisphosphate aldolase [Trebonia sp.]|jgi:fructose-bisphosphate aldolase class II
MPLVSMGEAVEAARPGGLAAFNVIQLEHAEAFVIGAETAGRPVVLQISENTARFHGALAPLGRACLSIAAGSAAPVVVHLDHAVSRDLITEAAELGLPSVMFDASALGYDENVAATAETATWCHERDVWVEAELGEIGGKDGVHAPGARTDPAQAAAYVAATGVDALAVAVGSSHAMLTRDARLDNELITAIAAAVPVPLVLHGSSGVADDGLVAAVRHGMAKINVATQLNKVLTGAVRTALAEDEQAVDPRRWMGAGRSAAAAEAGRLLDLLRPVS